MQRRASTPDNEHERILAALRESPAARRAVLSSLLRAYDDAPVSGAAAAAAPPPKFRPPPSRAEAALRAERLASAPATAEV